MLPFTLVFWALFCFMFAFAAGPYQGFGGQATGAGPKGTLYYVTNLADSGAGSFRDAVSAKGRIIHFNVTGYIFLKAEVAVSSDLTIDGSTAPDLGIAFFGESVSLSSASNVIISYIRFRQGLQGDQHKGSLMMDKASLIMLDHVSIEWGRWDNLDMNGVSDVTVQYSIIGAGIPPQQFGCLCESSGGVTLHHNLFVDNESRNPKAKGRYQLVNNIIYNWGSNGLVGGHSDGVCTLDLIGNYLVAGPNSDTNHYLSEFTNTDHVYLAANNYADLNKNGVLDGTLITATDFTKVNATVEPSVQLSPPVAVTAQTAEAAWATILKEAGDSLHRDSVDADLISQVQSIGKKGGLVTNPGVPSKLLPPA